MRVWLIDDERPCLEELAYLLKGYVEIEIVGMDTNPINAFDSMKCSSFDAVFLDIDMPKLNGLELAIKIQGLYPGIVIIFVTAHTHYALAAYKVHPLDYLLKPIKRTELDDCITYLKKQYLQMHPASEEKRLLSIRCFGEFVMLSQGEVKWETRRTRELFLYLIGRNSFPTTKEEMLKDLFDDRNDKNTVHNLYMTLYRLKNLIYTMDPQSKQIRLTQDYALKFATGVCDFADFMSFAKENSYITEKNAKQAEQVLALYKGTFLEKESFEWSSDPTYEAEVAYERIAIGLSKYLIASLRLSEAEHILTTLLMQNELCEEAHVVLLDLTLQIGNKEVYVQRYEQYESIMKKQLKLQPSAFYRKQYEKSKYH